MLLDSALNFALEYCLFPILIGVFACCAAYASENHMSKEAREEFDRYESYRLEYLEEDEKENLESRENE